MASPLNQRAGQPLCLCGRGGIGRHARLKILFLYRSAGSIPAARTIILLSKTTYVFELYVAEYWGILMLMEKFLTYWSILLYGAYALLIIWTVSVFGNEIGQNISSDDAPIKTVTVFKQGWTYAGYNLVILTAVLFAVRHMSTRKDAVISGILCGPLSMIPAFLLLFSMIPHYPAIVDEILPITYLLERLNSGWFAVFLQLFIFGTFIETGTALLHSINERVSESYRAHEKSMPRLMRPLISTIALIVAIYLANKFGVIDLIGRGYAYSTYLFLAIIVVPLLTRGIYLIATNPTKTSS